MISRLWMQCWWRFVGLAFFLGLVWASGSAARAERLVVERAGGSEGFVLESSAVTDLSGLTWLGGEQFVAVSDKQPALIPITLKIDRTTGRIETAASGAAIRVPSELRDFEGVAYVASTKAFFISAESGPAVLRFVPGAPRVERFSVPPIFAQHRRNLSLEALTWSDTLRQFWIANEEALKPDGPLADSSAGTLVRLQRLDAKFRPLGQFAWRTEPAAMRYAGAGSGVSDLCLLPGGELIVLERSFGFGGLHLRLFRADFSKATDTSRLPALDGANVVPAGKELLYSQATGFTNYEGLALGPVLADGSRSLVVVADSNGGTLHHFLALKIRTRPELVKKP